MTKLLFESSLEPSKYSSVFFSKYLKAANYKKCRFRQLWLCSLRKWRRRRKRCDRRTRRRLSIPGRDEGKREE